MLRRDLLKVGSVGWLGISLPSVLEAVATVGINKTKANSCVLLFMDGGPGQQDMWDMKPNAPADIRGEFKPISTNVPGITVCEGMPQVSKRMHHFCQIRSVTHDVNIHSAATYYMLTGREPRRNGNLIIKEEPDNFPPYGSVLSKLKPHQHGLDFVHLPEIIWDAGHDLPGQRSGFSGARFNPLVIGDPSVQTFRVPGLALPADVPQSRLTKRVSLLEVLDASAKGTLKEHPLQQDLDSYKTKALSLLASPAIQKAFDLTREPTAVRERYGLPDRTDRSKGARNFGGLPTSAKHYCSLGDSSRQARGSLPRSPEGGVIRHGTAIVVISRS